MSYRVTAGALPDGMTLSADGLISGTPTTAGTFAGTVTVSNGILPDATQDFRIVVESTGDNVGGNNGSGGGGALDGITLIALLVLPLLRAVRRRGAGGPATRTVCNRRLVAEFAPTLPSAIRRIRSRPRWFGVAR
jgi:putative Ig domain-containing protein